MRFDSLGSASRFGGIPVSAIPACILLAIALLTLSMVAGCAPESEKMFPVSGLVRFPDGTVLRNGSVEFEIIGRDPPITATGLIAADGTFTLGTRTLDDGALVGKHRVAIIADHAIGTGAERPGLIPESKLPRKYGTFDDSGLILEVRPEDNQVIIDVEPRPAATES